MNVVPVRNRAISVLQTVAAYKNSLNCSAARIRWNDTMQKDLLNQIEGTYMGRLYKLKDEFYNESKTAVTEEPDGICDDDMISYYFNDQAINGFEGNALFDRSDIYILGMALLTDVDMEEIDNSDEDGEEFCGVDVRS
jgi:hypothetical protein